MKLEGSSPLSQQPNTSSDFQWHEFIPHATTLFKIHRRRDLPRRSFIFALSAHNLVRISLLPHSCYMPNASLNHQSFISSLSVICSPVEGSASVCLHWTCSLALGPTLLHIYIGICVVRTAGSLWSNETMSTVRARWPRSTRWNSDQHSTRNTAGNTNITQNLVSLSI